LKHTKGNQRSQTNDLVGSVFPKYKNLFDLNKFP